MYDARMLHCQCNIVHAHSFAAPNKCILALLQPPFWRGLVACYEETSLPSHLCRGCSYCTDALQWLGVPRRPSTPSFGSALRSPLLSPNASQRGPRPGLPTPQHPFSVTSTRLHLSMDSNLNELPGTPATISPCPDTSAAATASTNYATPPGRLLSFPSMTHSDYGDFGRSAERHAEASMDLSGELLEGAATAVDRHAALVKRAEPEDFLVLLQDLCKRYGGGPWCCRQGTVAVDHVSLGVPEGHCFGLLGAGSMLLLWCFLFSSLCEAARCACAAFSCC
jgi:hypothetical protein